MDEGERMVSLSNDLAHLRLRIILLAISLFLLVIHLKELGLHTCRVRDHPLAGALLIDPCLELWKPLVLLPEEVLFTHVNEIDSRLPRQQIILVEQINLLGIPLAKPHVLLLLRKPCMNLQRHLEPVLLLLCLSITCNLLLERLEEFFNLCNVLQAQLIGDDFEVTDWVDLSFDVRALVTIHRFVEDAADMEDSICGVDVR
mmetsp:Transcript_13523/g.41050  ORF Transcript_13523/g.41050 Transcript_13523/m.41050 type:complete len:201 (-) Transcript_13523:417-1019(-)